MLIRDAAPADAPALAELINRIIAVGGTTAHQQPFTPASFSEHFIAPAPCLSCVIALDGDLALGFQAVGRDARLPPGCGDIGTFTRVDPYRPGVGSALFPETIRRLIALGFNQINATIRADNAGGLAYYARLGFRDHGTEQAVPLVDGTPVDRISKRYLIG